MSTCAEDLVREFYEGFGQQEFLPDAGTTPSLGNMTDDRLKLKLALIAEEFSELLDATLGKLAGDTVRAAYVQAVSEDDGTRDVVEAYDAMADLEYVIAGLSLEAGGDLGDVFEEVHRSNMSKLDDDGKPLISDGITPAPHDGKIKPAGKIMKSANYFDPDIRGVLFGQ